MSRPNPFLLIAALAAFIALFGGVTWAVGGLYLDTHEGDSFHLLDILTRMEQGDVPHLDFVTPLGALSFWPITFFIENGHSAGMAIILAQFGFAALLMPFVVYAAVTRMSRGVAFYFGCLTLALVLALSYGTATSGVGISMHYNRWAWAVTFVLLALLFLPSRRASRPMTDGALVGVLLAGLLLLKITYFVVLAPVAVLALVGMHGARGFLVAVVLGGAVMGGVAVVQGAGFWLAYLGDLQHVAGNTIRPYVGLTFDKIIAGPTHIAGTLLAIGALILVRQTAPKTTGLAMLLLVPGLFYVTYQNFGNGSAWLLFLPILMMSLKPLAAEGQVFGVDRNTAFNVVAIAAFAVSFPMLFNIATSPLAHASFDKDRFMPMLPVEAGHQDVFIRADRAYTMTAQVFRDDEPGPWAKYREAASRGPVHEFQGVQFPNCEWMAGSRAMFETLGDDLADAGLPDGSRLLAADLLSAFKFFAPVEPARGSAPWYYGGLSGIENTDFVMIPKCGFVTHVRGVIINEMKASDLSFELVRDNDLYALFRVSR